MSASSPTAFYFVELLKFLLPVLGTTFILLAIVRRYREVRSRSALWLAVTAAAWLLVTITTRLAVSAPARHYFISSTVHDYDTSHIVSLYFAFTEWLWTAEQLIVFLFGVLLFLTLRKEPHQHI